jgi:hypothetical protein
VDYRQYYELVKQLLRSPLNYILAFAAATGLVVVEKLEGSSAPAGMVGFWAFFALVTGSTAWLVLRCHRTLYGESPALEGVTAIGARGLIPFTEKDGSLFWKLGRINDIRANCTTAKTSACSLLICPYWLAVSDSNVIVGC